MRMAQTDEPTPPTEAPQVPRAAPAPSHILQKAGWALVWVIGAGIGLLAAGALAAWLWAATPGSLAQTIGWAQSWLKGQDTPIGQLNTDGVEGSLRGGGRIAELQ